MVDLVHSHAKVNWASPVTARWSFSTSVFTSREGYETRSAVREFPRFEMEFETLEGGRKSLPGRQSLAASLSSYVTFPDVTKPFRAIVTGAREITGAFDDFRFNTGKNFSVKSRLNYFRATVETNFRDRIVLEADLDIPIGALVTCFPDLVGTVSEGFESNFSTSEASRGQIKMVDYLDQTRVKDALDWRPTDWYRERPVVLWGPNWAEPVNQSWAWDGPMFSRDYGKPSFFRDSKAPRLSSAHSVVLKGPEQIEEMVSTFCYLRGRQGSFYAPTWVDDFLFVEPVQAGQTVIDVNSPDAKRLFDGTNTFKSIAIRKGERFHFSGVVDITVSGERCQVTIASPVPESFAGASRASWLLRQRFSSDTLELEFETSHVARANISCISLVEDTPILTIMGRELTIGGAYVTLGSYRHEWAFEPVTFAGYPVSIGEDFLE